MATSIALSSQAVSQPATSASTTAMQKKFLDMCIEDLDPSKASSFEQQSTLWKTAAVTTLVSYTVLAVSVFVATGVFAPIYVPIAGICALLLLNPVQQFYDRFQQYSNEAAVRADQLRTIQHNYADLTNASSEDMQRILFRMGIIWFNIPGMLQHPEDLHILKPLVARHRFWEGHAQKIETKKQEILQEANKLVAENKPENRDEIYHLRACALELDKRIFESKVKDAFTLAAMQRPTLTGNLLDIGDFSTLSSQERIIGNALNDLTVNNLFTFKNATFAPLTADEIKRQSVAELSHRLLAASPAA